MSREDLNELLDIVLPFARQMLAKHGEFYPFGARVSTDGKKGMSAGYTGSEMPGVQEVTDLLVGGFRDEARRGTIRASALCVNVTIDLPDIGRSDAVQVTLEDTDGEALNAFLPYKIRSPGHVEYGELTFGRARPQIFQ